MTHLWQTLLKRTGSCVVQEENRGSRALQTGHEFGLDLIVLDLNMPGFDGGDIAAGLSTDRRFKGTPLLFMTSLVSEREVVDGKRIEGHPCIVKPTSIAGLIVNIEKRLAARPARDSRTLAELAA